MEPSQTGSKIDDSVSKLQLPLLESDESKPSLYPKPLDSRESEIAKRTRMSVRATKRVIAPYVKARQRPLATIKRREENKYFNFYLKKKPSILMADMSKYLSDNVDLLTVLNDSSDVIKENVNAAGSRVYMVDEALDEIYQVPQTQTSFDKHRICWKIQPGTTVAAYVAYQKEYVMISDVLEDERFPDGLGHSDLSIQSVICVPIVNPVDECLAVMELYRTTEQPPFEDRHLRIVVVVCGWIGSAMFQNAQRLALQRQHELNEYLLDLTKCYFADTMLLDKLITEMVNFAKTAISAEHGSFYVIKRKYDEVWADCYEEGLDEESGEKLHKKNIAEKLEKESDDVLSYVAFEGKTINIKNLTTEEQFLKDKAKKRGYVVKQLLCMPIKGVDEILGIIQIANKKRGTNFTATDEILLNVFTIYCAFALHYHRLVDRQSKTSNLNDIYIDMLAHHMRPCVHDTLNYENSYIPLPARFNHFDWYLPEGDEPYVPQLTTFMLSELSKEAFKDRKQLVRFVLTVQKSYHDHPYHNFLHAFCVTHCAYNVLRRNLTAFTPLEVCSIMISALCHDIDHLGVTNNFLEIINHNLAQLYEESILENHHFHVTMFIIKDLKIYENFTQENYKILVTEIRQNIISTDLSLYFKRRSKLYQICVENSFDWKNDTHRQLIKSNLMTAADLSGQCKPFPVTKKLTEQVYKEFYLEGDREKRLGLCPLSIMDRDKQNAVPTDQVQFLTIVVLPCMMSLTKILPNCQAMYREALKLKSTWQEVVETQGVKTWKQEDSLPK